MQVSISNVGQATTDEEVKTWNEYKKIRNKINNVKKQEERRYKSAKVSENLDSPADTWKTAKTFMNWESAAGPPHQLCVNSMLITKAAEIATSMNEYFIAKVKIIRRSIASVPNMFLKCAQIMQDRRCKLSLKHVSVTKVNKLLKGLKNSRSTSIDELDNYCVKLAADVIDKPLHHIITLSVLQHKFPASWKYSKVIPLHKKLCKLERKNYRPVAILSPLSKILEKIIYEQLYDYFTKNKLFHQNLHGYRKHRSTQTALLQMYDRWVRAAGAGKVSGVVLLDLSAAFDLVDPEILIKKLRIYGLEEDFLCWVQSYLTNRHQAVWIDHALSEFLHCEVGVPQGSNLGPLFFLIFFNDLLFSLECDADSYADDTTLTAAGHTLDSIGEQLTESCATVTEWMKANKLKLNPDKTHILVMGTEQKLRNLTSSVQVVMDGVLLKEDPSKTELLLGCQLEAGLKWREQIKYVVSKLKTRLVALTNLRFIVPYYTRKLITQGIFNSTLAYCLPLYGGCDAKDIKELQVLQNKAAQLVTHSPPRATRSPMYAQLDWLTINQLVFFNTVLNVFKTRTTKEPEYLATHLCNDSRNGRITISNIKLSLAQKSFTFRGATSWNLLLPEDMRKIVKIGEFKKSLRKWTKINIPQFLD